MSKPVRIRLSRAKGWRMPPNTVKVARPSVWGNPFVVGEPCGVFPEGMGMHGKAETLIASVSLAQAVSFYREVLCGHLSPEMYPFGHKWADRLRDHFGGLYATDAVRASLRGKNLACWCSLDQPCHADVLLELANR